MGEFTDRLRRAVDTLLGVSAFEAAPKGTAIPDSQVENVREHLGGQIQPLPQSRLRWYLADLEEAQRMADQGNIRLAAQLCRAMNRDGTFRGLLRARTKGLLRLPKRFYGDDVAAKDLRAQDGTRSVFDEMCPLSELQLLAGDGVKLGIGVGELVPVKGRDYPILIRLQPEFLSYRWNENRWYFASLAGLEPIEPGKGRWVLHIPGGRQHPWESGDWYGLGRSFINKEHAIMSRANYCAKLANPARLGYAPAGATETQRVGFIRRLLAWGIDTTIEMPPGWDAKLLESNGRGWEVFQRQIDTSDQEYMIQLMGQVLTTKGGTGFDGQEEAKATALDLIQTDGDELAHTINTQVFPQYLVRRFGDFALDRIVALEWDTGKAADKERETRTLKQAAEAIDALTRTLAPYRLTPAVNELTVRFGIPVVPAAEVETVERPKLDLAPTDLARVVTVDEARASRGLPGIGDERGIQTIGELAEGSPFGTEEPSDGEDMGSAAFDTDEGEAAE